jgi:hypothetical protein
MAFLFQDMFIVLQLVSSQRDFVGVGEQRERERERERVCVCVCVCVLPISVGSSIARVLHFPQHTTAVCLSICLS